jgi:TRAP-type C4-dicarboxylate transport system substrate-binding protein
MNLKKFKSLSPKQQKILTDAQIEIEKEIAKINADLISKEKERLEKAGMTFTHLSPDEAKQWRKMANDTRFEVLSNKIGPEKTATIRALISRD